MKRMKHQCMKLHRLEKHTGDTSHHLEGDTSHLEGDTSLWPICDKLLPLWQITLSSKDSTPEAFCDTQFKHKSRGREEEEEVGGMATWLSWDAACSAYAFVRPFLWAAQVGELILPWSSSKPGEQPVFLFWITDACAVSEMKSLATELPWLPHFTHLAYSVCVL